MRLILSILAMSLLGNSALATAMSPQRSRCLALEEISKSHVAWKLEFRRFQTDETLTMDQKYNVGMRTAPKVLSRLQTIQKITNAENRNKGLISDTTRFLKAMENDIYTKQFAVKLLEHALPKFEDTIDEAIFHGEIENQCLGQDLVHRSKSSKAAR